MWCTSDHSSHGAIESIVGTKLQSPLTLGRVVHYSTVQPYSLARVKFQTQNSTPIHVKTLPSAILATTVSHNTHSKALKTTGIKQLKAPGINSNYLDWSFVVQLHLQACRVGYVLDHTDLKDHPSYYPPTWHLENITVYLVITKTIHSSNHMKIRDSTLMQGLCGFLFDPHIEISRQEALCTG